MSVKVNFSERQMMKKKKKKNKKKKNERLNKNKKLDSVIHKQKTNNELITLYNL